MLVAEMSENPPAHDLLPELDESDLLLRLRKREPDAFESMVRAFGGRMLSAIRRILPIEADALDALQDAFFSAFKALDRFQAGARFSTWLHRIAINAALMKLRTRMRKREASIEDLLPRYLDDGHPVEAPQPWTADEPDSPLEREEIRVLVRQAIETLPDNYRTVLVLRDIEELSTLETAETLGLTESVVKVRLHRARQALRTLLDARMRERRP